MFYLVKGYNTSLLDKLGGIVWIPEGGYADTALVMNSMGEVMPQSMGVRNNLIKLKERRCSS